MQNEELTQRLEALQDAADAQTQACESSRDKLYQNIVDAYLWRQYTCIKQIAW